LLLNLSIKLMSRAKYPLAMVLKITQVLGKRVLVGYDIGCSFQATVSRSPQGASFISSDSRFCVPAFHGFAHQYQCQMDYHPAHVLGAGLEDFEGTE
jgi:hypothetical protein